MNLTRYQILRKLHRKKNDEEEYLVDIEIDEDVSNEEEEYFFPTIPFPDGDNYSSTQPLPSNTRSRGRQKVLK